jgi:CNT family concentrative nucleoside transporter
LQKINFDCLVIARSITQNARSRATFIRPFRRAGPLLSLNGNSKANQPPCERRDWNACGERRRINKIHKRLGRISRQGILVMPLNLISMAGLFVMILLAWLVSSHRRQVNWRLVAVGVTLQAVLAAVLFQSQTWTFDRQFSKLSDAVTAIETGELSAGQLDATFERLKFENISVAVIQASVKADDRTMADWDRQFAAELADASAGFSVPRFENGILFSAVNSIFSSINAYVAEGSNFVFAAYDPPGQTTDTGLVLRTFAFGVLPTVIFFASLMAVLYHLGVMQRLVAGMAWVMQRTLGTTGPESMAAAANVLVGHTEAPLMVRPYVAGMTRSELNALMVGGFATISGSLMVIFVNQGVSAGHLLTASLISAPAALVIAKIMQPETEELGETKIMQVEEVDRPTNVIEAAAVGAGEGLKLALNIGAMLIAFLALLAMFDALIFGCGELVEMTINSFSSQVVDIQWSLKKLFGMIFYPLAWIMGIENGDCGIAGELLGKKVVVNEFVAYLDMANYINADGGPKISDRTQLILTYALCGFSNFGAIGIQLGGIGPLAPERRSDLAQLGLRAMFGGMLAACMTACMAGMMDGLIR